MSELILGDAMEIMAGMPGNSVDSIVTDPPYGLSFMGKKWDYDVPGVDVWREALRVLKPGGHILCFAGTRTQHRMCCNIEDAGFEIRDMIAWIYGSGFPKSLDISKKIDEQGGHPTLRLEISEALKKARISRGITKSDADKMFCGGTTLYSWYEGRPAGIEIPTSKYMRKIADEWPELEKFVGLTMEAEREIIGKSKSNLLAVAPGQGNDRSETVLDITAPATPEALQWDGFGTALKPALEPITLARKPIHEKTIADNVLKYGTGGLNIDGCRIDHNEPEIFTNRTAPKSSGEKMGIFAENGKLASPSSSGRFPANLIHDGSPEVEAIFPETGPSANSLKGMRPSSPAVVGDRNYIENSNIPRGFDDNGGSTSRFFYCAKASRHDRDEGIYNIPAQKQDPSRKEGNPGGDNPRNRGLKKRTNNHPTVKPVDLMRYLCRLITPPGGIILDPFVGSGSTGKGAALEGFRFIGIDNDPESVELARARVAWAEEHYQGKLF